MCDDVCVRRYAAEEERERENAIRLRVERAGEMGVCVCSCAEWGRMKWARWGKKSAVRAQSCRA